jgi:hypothetical protein
MLFPYDTLKSKGVDTITGLEKIKLVITQGALENLGENDLLITWDRPQSNRTISDSSEWQKLSDSIIL